MVFLVFYFVIAILDCVGSLSTLSIDNMHKQVNVMTQDVTRKNERKAFWLMVAICLVPLIPYALRGGS